MCVQDLQGDGVVDLIYFTDTKEIFMYQNGKRDLVAEAMPFHRCAVPLDAGMQATTNRILNRENLSVTEELSITMELITNYLAAKPSIDACNARFEDNSDNEAEVPPRRDSPSSRKPGMRSSVLWPLRRQMPPTDHEVL